jgi:signal transduction histidine kinase
MWLRKFRGDLYFRFQFTVTLAIFTVFMGLFLAYSFYKQSTLRDEFRNIIEIESLNILSTHQEDRKRYDFHTLQRYLQNIPHVESVALFDKKCQLLNTTFLSRFISYQCKKKQSKLIEVQYFDVISPIGYVVFVPNLPKLNPLELFVGFVFSILIGFFASYIVTQAWRHFVYNPLHSEINQIAKGESPELQELGILGDQIKFLIEKSNLQERAMAKTKFNEERAKTVLKIAHDILSPLNLLKKDTNLDNLSNLSKRAIKDLYAIAYELLPEKKGITQTQFSILELIQDAISQAASSVQTAKDPILNVFQDFTITSSRPHLMRTLTNLIKNAFEVEPDNKAIHIEAKVITKSLVFSITDHGPGFNSNMSLISTKATGSGLGISSAKASIGELGGKLDFHSSSSGTTVTITLPLNLSVDFAKRQIVLIEDDKYIIQNWIFEANKAGIKLRVINHADFDILDNEVVYYDRMIQGIDISSRMENLITQGVEAYSISAIDNPNGKTPPWLTTPPIQTHDAYWPHATHSTYEFRPLN